MCYRTSFIITRRDMSKICQTIRSIYDIMDFTVKENIPGLMVFIDFQKAFDSVEWEFIFKCLEVFNFGPVEVFVKEIHFLPISS